jgi:predicted transcriptional regulator of viral defense system
MNKQLEIQKYLSTVPSATIDEIYANVSFSYYCNANKHLGEILSRMVKDGKIERVKKGLFRYINASEYANNFKKSKCQKKMVESNAL